jgi:hypothetical protein
MAAALGGALPDILYDGMVDPAWGHKGKIRADCLTNNTAASFLASTQQDDEAPVKDLRKVHASALAGVSIRR